MRPIGRSRRPCSDAGQSTVELALCLPMVALCLALVVQVGCVVHDCVLVQHAAREAARAAAVTADPSAPVRAAAVGSGLDQQRLLVTVTGRGAPGAVVRVDVTFVSVTSVPLIGALMPDVTLHASAAMRVER